MKSVFSCVITSVMATISFQSIAAHSPVSQNKSIESFSKAKKLLLKNVYHDHRTTLYCGASFSLKKAIDSYNGYSGTKYKKRAKRIEWEHVVPAQNFGQSFTAWRTGDKQCVNNKGKAYKGRRCANKSSKEYRLMQADLYNLFPAIGSVNAYRSNFNFVMLPSEKSDFGACDMRIENKKAQPPKRARGQIARAYLYMEDAYKKFKMSTAQRKLMAAWDKKYPVTPWECERNKRIEKLQKSNNRIMNKRCGISTS
ncbi:endonuclease [Psychrobium sp. nBUS_13]|uniref:endonuclease n=1 Tax=Psychrobium sp. nBUS_13 TaxID=3395319 RepID=UPI003EC0C06F